MTLNALLRNISLVQAVKQTGDDELTIHEVPEQYPVWSHWMALILVSAPSLSVQFKAHFKSIDVGPIVSSYYGMGREQVSEESIVKSLREFCNLVGGEVKRILGRNGVGVGVSLPVTMRGFDEIFTPQTQSPNAKRDVWILASPQMRLTCTSTIEILEPLYDIDWDAGALSATTDGDVEFL